MLNLSLNLSLNIYLNISTIPSLNPVFKRNPTDFILGFEMGFKGGFERNLNGDGVLSEFLTSL